MVEKRREEELGEGWNGKERLSFNSEWAFF
jgi:hypothetical protein